MSRKSHAIQDSFSAAVGAAKSLAERVEKDSFESATKNNYQLSSLYVAELQKVLDKLSQIDGLDISFAPKQQGDRVYANSTIGQQKLAVIVDADPTYSIYNKDEYPSSRKKHASYEGRVSSLKDLLPRIAMIAGYNYPHLANKIDAIINLYITENLNKDKHALQSNCTSPANKPLKK